MKDSSGHRRRGIWELEIQTHFLKVKTTWNCINRFNCIHRRRLQSGPELFFPGSRLTEAQNLEYERKVGQKSTVE